MDRDTTRGFPGLNRIKLDALRFQRRYSRLSAEESAQDVDIERTSEIHENLVTLTPLRSCWYLVQSFKNKFRGSRYGVIACTIASSFILVINISLFLAALVFFDRSTGTGTLFVGNCDLVKNRNSALHLLINALSSILFCASSYTMQCLSSPTRQDVDNAHARQRSLDIGLLSMKNLFHIDGKKVVLWWILCLSSLPLHLLWNSIIFSTTSATKFAYLVVDETFLTGLPYTLPINNECDLGDGCSEFVLPDSIQNISAAYHAGHFRGPFTASECVSLYSQPFLSTRRNLLAITQPYEGVTRMSPSCAFPDTYEGMNSSSLIAFEYECTGSPRQWLCQGETDLALDSGSCTLDAAESMAYKSGWYLRPFDDRVDYKQQPVYPITYCMIEEDFPQHCTLEYIPTFLAVVAFCNFLKVISMLATVKILWKENSPILATVGDAVASFLDRPDVYTQSMSLMSLSNYRLVTSSGSWNEERNLPITYERTGKRMLFFATSKMRWFTTMLICTVYLVFGLVLLLMSIKSLAGKYPSLLDIWNFGLGKSNTDAVLKIRAGKLPAIYSEVLVANAFQLALSTTYFLYNSLFTAQCSALEWSMHAKEYRPLRVTVPAGEQKSSWFLQLPFKLGAPLTVMFMVLHFFVSQSIFGVRIQWYNLDDTKASQFISGVGYSPLGMLCSVCVGAALLFLQILHALCPLDTSIPIHGNLSIAVSAACHPPQRERIQKSEHGQHLSPHRSDRSTETSISTKRLKWGAVSQARVGSGINAVGHCSLAAKRVKKPIAGLLYA